VVLHHAPVALAELLSITITNDAFNAFVFLESSLSSYALIAMGRNRKALVAAYQYLIMGTIGAGFYVIGVGFLYMMTGTLNLTLIGGRIGEVQPMRPDPRRHWPSSWSASASSWRSSRSMLAAATPMPSPVGGDRVPCGDRDQGRRLPLRPLPLRVWRRSAVADMG
jgi:hypothetical protein